VCELNLSSRLYMSYRQDQQTINMVPRAIKKSDRSIEDALPPRLSETWSLLASVSQYGGMCRPERLGILFGTLTCRPERLGILFGTLTCRPERLGILFGTLTCRPERLGILFGTLKTSTGLATFGHGQCKVGGKSEWVVCKSM